MQNGACRSTANGGRADTTLSNLFSRGNHMITALIHFSDNSFGDKSFLTNHRLGFWLRHVRVHESNFVFSERTLRFLPVNA
jgi:hypothetical protein